MIGSNLELDLVKRLEKINFKDRFLVKGIGDDCAVIKYLGDYYLLISSDVSVNKVHFDLKKDPLKFILEKAVLSSVSDILACGGRPLYLILSAAFPKDILKKYKEIIEILKKISKKFNLKLIGGDTSKAQTAFIDATVIGLVRKKELLLRDNVNLGDKIFVTGTLGKGKFKKWKLRYKEVELIKKYSPKGVIDITDGLVLDLYRVLSKKKLGAYLYKENIPLFKKASLEDALFWGEDFEILFFLSSQKAKTFLNSEDFKKAKFSFIGEVIPEKAIYLKDKSFKKKLPIKGYLHF